MNARRLLAIGAHPDDIEYGCYGTVLSLRPKAFLGVLMSEGSKGDATAGPERVEESRRALGRTRVCCLHWSLDAMTQILADFRPNLILTHTPHDTHQEHRAAYDLTLAAARRSQASILRYITASLTPEFRPTLWVDVSKVYQKKLRALACHESQADKTYMQRAQLDVFHAAHYPRLHGLACTEAFEIERMFW